MKQSAEVPVASVIFLAALAGAGRVAGTVMHVIDESLPKRERFELSQDGESLYGANAVYDFVGFSSDCSYTAPDGSVMLPGQKLGYVEGDEYSVSRLSCAGCGGSYVMVSGEGAGGEVYRMRA